MQKTSLSSYYIELSMKAFKGSQNSSLGRLEHLYGQSVAMGAMPSFQHTGIIGPYN